MPRLPKAQRLPDSSFSEPSEPSQLRPEDKPARALRGEQEENPQLVAHSRGLQAVDAQGPNPGVNGPAASGNRGNEGQWKRGPRDADEEKRGDVAGGFNVGRSKL